MKKIILLILSNVFILNINATVILTKKMKENSLDSAKYQLFVTKLGKENGISKIIIDGDYSDYLKFMKIEDERKNNQIINDSLKYGVDKGLNSSSIMSDSALNGILKNAGLAIVGNYLGNLIAADDHYVQVTDYSENGKLIGRMIKYIISKESLNKQDRQMIYASSYNESYGYNKGKIGIYHRNKKLALKYAKEEGIK